MYRVLAVLGASLFLAACTSSPSWLNLDSLKPEPPTDEVSFESTPPNAEVKTATGQACRTPCSLKLPANEATTVTFTLNGYQPSSEQLELVALGDGTTHLQPNPVSVELVVAPPPPKKPAARTKRPAKPKTAAAPKPAKPAPAPAAAAPAAPAASPWPTNPQPAR